jgi:hypothetical protein
MKDLDMIPLISRLASNMLISGDSHHRRRQVCNLCQKELEVNKFSVTYSDTSSKLQYLSIVLDDNTLLVELELNVKISEDNMSSLKRTRGRAS